MNTYSYACESAGHLEKGRFKQGLAGQLSFRPYFEYIWLQIVGLVQVCIMYVSWYKGAAVTQDMYFSDGSLEHKSYTPIMCLNYRAWDILFLYERSFY